MLSARKVVLLLPPYDGAPLGPPAGLLALASPLREAGFEPRIVDAAVDLDWIQTVLSETEDALCFGVSLLTGPMIDGAVKAAKAVRAARPELPIVFGGWHPTLLSEQTLREPYVDAVVRGQGEATFVEVCERLAEGRSLDGAAGCWWKSDNKVRKNPERATLPVEELPTPAYDLVDFDAYERVGGGRKLPYATSVGCPYACRYCTDTVFYNRRFNAYEVERAVGEVTALVREHRIEEVALLDSNFLVNVHRARAIAQGFLDSGVRFKWTFQASTDLLCRLSDEDVELLARSGVGHIGFGTESASESVLRAMDKRHQTIDDMFECARKTHRAGIRVTYNLIFGFPGETEADRDETIRVMGAIAEKYDNVTFSPNVFTPYPGIPVWPELERLGMRQPGRLEAWREVSLGADLLPWLQGEERGRLDRRLEWFVLANALTKKARRARLRSTRWAARAMRRTVSWRLQRRVYSYPAELWLYGLQARLATRRSLLTGEAL